MKTMQELVSEIGTGEIMVTDVEIVETDMGGIIRVHMQSMNHPHVLSMTIDLPDEVSDQYDFQDCGEKWKAGWDKLRKHLDQKGRDHG